MLGVGRKAQGLLPVFSKSLLMPWFPPAIEVRGPEAILKGLAVCFFVRRGSSSTPNTDPGRPLSPSLPSSAKRAVRWGRGRRRAFFAPSWRLTGSGYWRQSGFECANKQKWL